MNNEQRRVSMKDKFKNKNGSLTKYALACGYIEKMGSNNISFELYHNAGNSYDVRAFDNINKKRLFWFSSEKLAIARKIYRAKHNYLKTYQRLSGQEKFCSGLTEY